MSANNYTLRASEQYLQEQFEYHKKLINIRWLYITFLTAVAHLSTLFSTEGSQVSFLYLGGIGLVLNFGLFIAIRTIVKLEPAYLKFFAFIQILVDITIASMIVYFRGGGESRTTILYAIPIITSGILFSRSLVFVSSFLSGLGYILAVVLEHNANRVGSLDMLPLVFYPATFLITSTVVYMLVKSRSQDVALGAYKEVLAMLTHQLRHPLTTSLSIADVLKNEKKLTKKRRMELVSMLEKVNHEGFILVNNLLEEASENTLRHMEKINLTKLIQETVDVCAISYSREGDIVLNFEDKEDLFVRGNRYQLSTAFMNIIDNAFKHSRVGKTVEINLRSHDKFAVVSVTNKTTKASIKKITKRFNDFDNKEDKGGYSGSGLGLVISRKIISNFGGNIDIESNGFGVTISVTLKRIKN